MTIESLTREEYLTKTRSDAKNRKAISILPSKEVCELLKCPHTTLMGVQTDEGMFLGMTGRMYFKLSKKDYEIKNDGTTNLFEFFAEIFRP